MKRLVTILFAAIFATLTFGTQAAQATDWNPGNTFPPGAINVGSPCDGGWYVNADEAALLPQKQPTGFLFDGPSLVHHHTYFKLSQAPGDGSFVADVLVGVAPLFKLETANVDGSAGGYSTINKTAAGKYWSSKIAAGDPGGISNPVDTLADLIDKPWTKTPDPNDKYIGDLIVYSFGVGYANDAGNSALVKSVKWAGVTYNLGCSASPSPSPSVSPSVSVSPSPSVKLSRRPSATKVATVTNSDQLPTTGAPTYLVAGLGAAAVAAGVVGLVASRRRRERFEA